MIDRVRGLPPGTRFVGIDGLGGAGKSTLATLIAEAVPRSVVVHVDDFAAPAVPEWDWSRFHRQLLEPLLSGATARYQVGRWDLGVGEQRRVVRPGAIVLVEGVSSTRCEVAAPWDVTIWVDAPAGVRRSRAIARDGEAMWPVWEQRWIPPEEAYVARENPRARADLLVDGTAIV